MRLSDIDLEIELNMYFKQERNEMFISLFESNVLEVPYNTHFMYEQPSYGFSILSSEPGGILIVTRVL